MDQNNIRIITNVNFLVFLPVAKGPFGHLRGEFELQGVNIACFSILADSLLWRIWQLICVLWLFT
jgi:hypothetical protein